MLAATVFFLNSNYLEAILWLVIAAGFAVAALLGKSGIPGRLCIAAISFAAFGVSDVVEVQTGAWWRPWWLFAWKAACVACFLVLYIDYVRRRAKSRRQPVEDAEAEAPR